MSNAIAGLGTEFRRWNPNPSGSSAGAWEKLAEIRSIDGPGMSRETIDVTTLDTTGGYREFIASLRDAGTISFTMNFTRAAYELMKQDFEDNTVKNYEIVLPDEDTTTLEFEGLVTELPLSIEVDGAIQADITIKISGKVELNSGSGS
jgi:predicted secreted protein